jgi:hypothetical protein
MLIVCTTAGHGQSGPARTKNPGPGLHVGPSSGLILEPERRAGLDLGLQKIGFKPSSGQAFPVRARCGADLQV